MSIILYFLGALIILILLIIVTGLILPDERTETRSSEFDVPPQLVYSVITNNGDYAYRSDLKEIVILENNGDIEVWEEIAKNGNIIRFKTAIKEPFSRYEFDIIKANGFTGHWIGILEETPTGGTLFTATEIVRIKNPVVKVLSYLFFDIGKFMETYQEDLKGKLKSLK